ncbi:MAG: hypothetical protein AAF997_02135 [Myxococcota bacterium]
MTESGARLVFWMAATGIVGALLAIPQPVAPWEMPSLVLDRAAVANAVRESKDLAAKAPDGDHATRLRELFLDHGRAERSEHSRKEHDARQTKIHQETLALAAEHGPEAFDAIRARAVEDFVAGFEAGRLEPRNEEEAGTLGGFDTILERYGAVYDGVLVAPELTLRSMYKARWNLIHRVEATRGFSPIEHQSYWGWLALHGWGVPLEDRTRALARYKEAGGRSVLEAAALFDLLKQQPNRAATLLAVMYENTDQLRFRNLSLGALRAAVAPRP